MSKLFTVIRHLLPYSEALSHFLIILSVAYLLVLPDKVLQRHTYISENALMPDYASTHFNDSFRVDLVKYAGKLVHSPNYRAEVGDLLRSVTRHPALAQEVNSNVIYGVIESERSDGTEALALVAPLFIKGSKKNICGVSSVLALAKSFMSLNHWARDIVIVFPEAGPSDLDAWLDAHLTQRAYNFGTIQAALCFEIDGTYCDTGFDHYSLRIEGPNGLLPNLDLVNTIVKLAEPRRVEVDIGTTRNGGGSLTRMISRVPYLAKLSNIVSMLYRQALYIPQNVHGSFLKARIDAVTLVASESKRRENDDFHSFKFKNFYEIIEGTLRSLNNVLEHLHQSFFFYILPDNKKFISIANFLPVTGLFCASLLLKAFHLKMDSSYTETAQETCFLIGLIIFNYFLWFVAKTLMAISKLTIYASPILLALTFIFVLKKSLNMMRFSPKSLRGSVLIILAITIFAMSFLNFGLAVFCAAASLPFSHGRIKQVKWLLLPSSLILIGSVVPGTREYARSILSDPFEWNFGMPFLIIQPMMTVLI